MERDHPGVEVRQVSSALDFADAIADGGFDLVISDCRFSWADGPSLLRRLKTRFPDVPVVLMARNLDARDEAGLFEAEPADFLQKSSMGVLALPKTVRAVLRRMQLRQERSIAEQALQTLLERSQKGVFRADWTGRLIEANQALADMLGPSQDGLEVRLPGLHFQSASREELQKRLRKEGSTHRREVEIPRARKEPLWVAITETVGQDSAGNPVIEGIVEDISAGRQLQEELRRSNRDLQNFAHVASHELQEPLRMVERYTKILADDYGKQLDKDGLECVRFANEGAQRMQRLIDDLLAFSRIESQAGDFKECDSGDLVDEALRNIRAAVEDKKAVVTTGRLPKIKADPRQIVQLFQNLIGNAIKFHAGPDVPRVRIMAELSEGTHRFAVRDNGIGIEKGQLENIFKLFKRLDPNQPGSGLGLAICKRIVERHGGEIWAESEVGEGSTFYFKIPVTPPV